jgi:hypothetical protein
MASTLPGAGPAARGSAAHPQPGRPAPQIPSSLRAPWGVPALVSALAALFLWISYFEPLWHTDLWGHLAYGRYLWGRGLFPLPATEPLMPLATGVPFVDTAWLSQLLGYLTFEQAGLAGLIFLYAGAITLCAALLAFRFFRRTGNPLLALAGVGLFLWVAWQQLQVVRPQLAGLVLFVALFVILTARRWSSWNWVIVPALFALWANVHGSFPVGLALIAAFCIGRAADIERRTHRFRLIFADRGVRRYFVLLEVAAVATLLNPYGLGIYAEVLSIATHENLRDLLEWEPLTLRMQQGKAAAFAAAVLIFAYRLSPRRVRSVEVVLLLGFGLATLWTSRMIVWWAPLAACYVVLHGAAIWNRERSRPSLPARRVSWTALALAVPLIALTVSPLGLYLLRGGQPEPRRVLSRGTPIGVAEYLNQNPPEGLIFNPYEWGDYLLWAGPPDLQVFVASHAHLVPQRVWQHYRHIIGSGAEWSELLSHYGINTVLLDKPRRGTMIARLRRNEGWQVAYEDDRAVIFSRREPIE